MDIKTLLRSQSGKITITNAGSYGEPTYAMAAQAPSIDIATIISPSTTRPLFDHAVRDASHFLESARCERNSCNFPSDPRKLFTLNGYNGLQVSPPFKIWKVEITGDNQIILNFMKGDAYAAAPSHDQPIVYSAAHGQLTAHTVDQPPLTLGQVIVETQFFDANLTVAAYDEYPEMLYKCRLMGDPGYPDHNTIVVRLLERDKGFIAHSHNPWEGFQEYGNIQVRRGHEGQSTTYTSHAR